MQAAPLILARTVVHAEVFEASAAAVWKLLVDWAGIGLWMPEAHIRSVEIEGSGPGAVRHLVTGQGVRIAERLDTADEAAGIVELSILEPLPWGMLSYRARATLQQLGGNRCRLTWRGTFTMPESGPDPEALARFLKKAYQAMFLGIRRASEGKT